MKILIITQDEPFYLADSLNYLFNSLPSHSKVVGCIVNEVSPFGKKETFLEKAKKTYSVFGFNFFMYYSIKFIKNRFDSSKSLTKLLEKYNIPKIILTKPINSKSSVDTIKSYKPDLLVSILGNQIFKRAIIDLAPKGCINLHTALLPKYRGLMPTFWVMKNSEKYTGVSIFFVDEGIDSGDIIVQKKVEIGDRTQEELIRYTKKIGMQSIIEAIDLIEKDRVNLIENDASKMTYFSFPTKDDVKEFKKIGKRFF